MSLRSVLVVSAIWLATSALALAGDSASGTITFKTGKRANGEIAMHRIRRRQINRVDLVRVQQRIEPIITAHVLDLVRTGLALLDFF
jgi:hypothetical protein